MTGWLTLSLALWLGQAQPGSPLAQNPEAARADEELRRLRARLQELQAQVETLSQEAAARLEVLEQRQAAVQERARDAELLQQQQRVSLQRAYQWLAVADQQLEEGEIDVGPVLLGADEALAVAQSSAEQAGRGQALQLIRSARIRIAAALEAAGRRDTPAARLELLNASFELGAAWRSALNRPDSSVLSR